MKPKIFIGSSTERLELAYTIQENLDFDALTTVWTQGIFKLSQNALDSLVESLENFDYAIFIFHPDDITQIRDKQFDTVRDNLIFELGLFIGKLGKERVYFLIPRSIESLHLPTDLLGITPGTYNDKREDGNLKASLGPFCNQVRDELKDFTYQNVIGIENESKLIKKIVIEQKTNWEINYAAQLLKDRLQDINQAYLEINKDFIIQKKTPITGQEFFEWFDTTLSNFQNFLKLLEKCINELGQALKSELDQSKSVEIKNAVERIIQLCKECISWEYELNSYNPPDELLIIQNKLKGVTETLLIKPFNSLQLQLENIHDHKDENNNARIEITPTMPSPVMECVDDFRIYLGL